MNFEENLMKFYIMKKNLYKTLDSDYFICYIKKVIKYNYIIDNDLYR